MADEVEEFAFLHFEGSPSISSNCIFSIGDRPYLLIGTGCKLWLLTNLQDEFKKCSEELTIVSKDLSKEMMQNPLCKISCLWVVPADSLPGIDFQNWISDSGPTVAVALEKVGCFHDSVRMLCFDARLLMTDNQNGSSRDNKTNSFFSIDDEMTTSIPDSANTAAENSAQDGWQEEDANFHHLPLESTPLLIRSSSYQSDVLIYSYIPAPHTRTSTNIISHTT
jgi:hypothetical protein